MNLHSLSLQRRTFTNALKNFKHYKETTKGLALVVGASTLMATGAVASAAPLHPAALPVHETTQKQAVMMQPYQPVQQIHKLHVKHHAAMKPQAAVKTPEPNQPAPQPAPAPQLTPASAPAENPAPAPAPQPTPAPETPAAPQPDQNVGGRGGGSSIQPVDGTQYPYANAPFPNEIVDPWGMYERQCVSYTAWAVAASGRNMPNWGGHGNANDWDANAQAAGIPVDTTPKVGDVAVRHDAYFGHVMYVDAVNADGTITISQYNANLTGDYSTATIGTDGLVFIHFP